MTSARVYTSFLRIFNVFNFTSSVGILKFFTLFWDVNICFSVLFSSLAQSIGEVRCRRCRDSISHSLFVVCRVAVQDITLNSKRENYSIHSCFSWAGDNFIGTTTKARLDTAFERGTRSTIAHNSAHLFAFRLDIHFQSQSSFALYHSHSEADWRMKIIIRLKQCNLEFYDFTSTFLTFRIQYSFINATRAQKHLSAST